MKSRFSRVAMVAAIGLFSGIPLTSRADASDVLSKVFACLATTSPGDCLATTLPPAPPPPPDGPGSCGPTGGC